MEGLDLEDDEDELNGWITNPNPQFLPRSQRAFNPSDWMPEEILNIPSNRSTNALGLGLGFGIGLGARIVRPVASQPINSRLAEIRPIINTPNEDSLEAFINELNELEAAQNELRFQIRQLENAHLTLERARGGIINALISLDSNTAVGGRNVIPSNRPWLDDQENDNDEEDFITSLLNQQMSPQFVSRLPSPVRGISQAVPAAPRLFHFNMNHDINPGFDLFLDANGNSCKGFEDCIKNAVGWAGNSTEMLDVGLDMNGMEITESFNFSFLR
jgi:hypothetical protein